MAGSSGCLDSWESEKAEAGRSGTTCLHVLKSPGNQNWHLPLQ